jgi:signal transduction histidine kinase
MSVSAQSKEKRRRSLPLTAIRNEAIPMPQTYSAPHIVPDEVVRVQDSEIGIAAEILPHIFNLFMQADTAVPCRAAPRSGSGLGIGLALVRAIVESHGGRVTALNAGLGQGSEFTVRLPLEQ